MTETALPKLHVRREVADQKIKAQIEDGEQILEREIGSEEELEKLRLEANNWSDYNKTCLGGLINQKAKIGYVTFHHSQLTLMDKMNIVNSGFPGALDWLQYLESQYKSDLLESISSLRGIRNRLELYENFSDTLQHNRISVKPTNSLGNEIFIVHGRDEEAKETVARFVEKLGLKATILHEKPSSSLTIIEKIEKYSDSAGFAIVLLTPDDNGALKDSPDDQRNPRARQNVVFN